MSRSWWLTGVKLLSDFQRINIDGIPTFLFPDEYNLTFPYKHNLNLKGDFHNFSVPMLYHPQYEKAKKERAFENLEHYSFFKKIRETHDFVLFSHSRQNGENLPENFKVHEKGNLLLIRGFAKFIKTTEQKCCLVLFEYGLNIQAAKDLIHQLNIEQHIIWAPKMKRKEIMFGLINSDVSCGQFINSWLTCGVVNETLAAAVPLLHYRNDNLYQDEYEELYPLLNANTEDQIVLQLQFAINNPEKIKADTKNGLEWIVQYNVKKAMDVIKSSI